MKKAIIVLLLFLPLAAQNVAPKPADIPRPDAKNFSTYEAYEDALIDWRIQMAAMRKLPAVSTCATLVKCRAALKGAAELNESIKSAAALESAESAKRNEELQRQVANLTKQYQDSITILETLNANVTAFTLTNEQQAKLKTVLPGKALDLGASIEAAQSNIITFTLKLKEHDATAVDKYNALLGDYKDYVNRVGIQLAEIGRQNRVNNALALYGLMPKYNPPQTLNLNVTDCTKFPALCVH